MVKKSIASVVSASVPPSVGIELLNRQIDKGQALLGFEIVDRAQFDAWENTNREFLVKAFGSDSPNVGKVCDIGRFGSIPMNAGEGWLAKRRKESIQPKLVMLKSLVELLETEMLLQEGSVGALTATRGHSVFVVHGHHGELLETSARL
jgi:hypothetical protein